ncbi:thiopeptide-type bacteriocin biosynthesis protein [Chengkuizengella axinellae]|uniref:Thiopeptide-type bacteriocin biosynthesis protein n=1 Tax=Chengkuizengella axinellae TaxID=3064388 RepID=A0ABT9ITR3_9BACL|nr:thiopeptide-type bacteriocin biosynthesis protein [Chengkuizengella sp. 2205SS18-9]MDP5272677.1 thiopeptide-type bacteriocin biosynthesis protein [Chengkuizengella sp. 2205SS18-9]
MSIYNKYIVRSPAIEKNYIYDLFYSSDLHDYILNMINDLSFMERILVASHDLYHQLIEIKNGKQMNEDVVVSVMKYILRMSSRPMPYGLFAGLLENDFNSNTNSTSDSYKEVRVSLDWLNLLVRRIEQSQVLDSNLLLYKNNLLRETNDKFYLDIAVDDSQNRISLRKTKFLQDLMSVLDTSKGMNEVTQLLSGGNSQKEHHILEAIKRLLNNNMILSHLRPHSILSQEDRYGLQFILKEKALINTELYEQLLEIEQLIESYKYSQVGKGIQTYQEMIQKMSEVCKSKRYVVVDQVSHHASYKLDAEIAQHFVDDIQFLTSFNVFNSFHKLWENYEYKFLDEYGFFNEINLIDLIDEDTGIGTPKFNQDYNSMNSVKEDQFNEYLLDLIQVAILNNKDHIHLSKSDIQFITDLFQTHLEKKINEGYDVKFNIIKENDKEKIVLNENSFSNTSTSFRGRFKLNTKEDKSTLSYNNCNYVSVEVNVVANHYSDLGVTYDKDNIQLLIHTPVPCENNAYITIKDIVVGLDHNGLYLKSKSLGKKIIPTFTHMLYYSNFNEDPSLLFLHQYGKYISNTPRDFYLGVAENLNYIPRIEYKQNILSLKRWRIKKTLMEREVNTTGKSKRQYLLDFVENYNVDAVVYMLKGDMSLPIHVHTSLGMDLLLNELNNQSTEEHVVLTEAPELNDPNDSTMNLDFIITVLPELDKFKQLNEAENCYGDSVSIPDLSWIYYHIYYRKGERIKISCSCMKWLDEQKIHQYFIVSYSDAAEHIRLRFKHDNPLLKEKFHLFLQQWVKDKTIKKYSEEIFFPEYSRYGGHELCNVAYEFFCYDTKFLGIVNGLKQFNHKSKLEQGVMVCLYTVMDLFDRYDTAFEFLRDLRGEKNKSVLKEFSTNRQKYTGAAREILFIYDRENDVLFQKRKIARKYSEQVHRSFQSERSFYIFKSVVHMTMNRFMGIDRELENKVYETASYTFYNLKYTLDIQGGYHELL